MSEKHVTDYTTAAETKPFTLDCGHQVGNIHHSGDGVPFLQVMDGFGNFLRIYGYAEIECCCGAAGDWHPGKRAMRDLLRNKRQRDMALDILLAELKEAKEAIDG